MRQIVCWTGLTALVVCVSCGDRADSRVASARREGARQVVVYSSADKELAELVFRAYEQKSGARVLPVYDTEETKTAGLTARLLAASRPKADVFWSSDTSRAAGREAPGRAVGRGTAAPGAGEGDGRKP